MFPFWLFNTPVTSHTCCHDLTYKFESGVPTKGCQVRNHIIKDSGDSNKSKQRAKVRKLFMFIDLISAQKNELIYENKCLLNYVSLNVMPFSSLKCYSKKLEKSQNHMSTSLSTHFLRLLRKSLDGMASTSVTLWVYTLKITWKISSTIQKTTKL